MPPRSSLIALLVLVLTGCRAGGPKEPIHPPALGQDVRHFAGSALSGPLGAELDTGSSLPEALRLTLDGYYLESTPGEVLAPLSNAARMFAFEDADPVRATSSATTRVRFARGEDAARFFERVDAGEFGRFSRMAPQTAAAPRGVTVAFRMRAATAGATLEVTRETERTSVTVSLAEGDSPRELVLLAGGLEPDGEALAFLFPHEGGGAHLWSLAASTPPADDPRHVADVEACLEAVREELARVRRGAEPLPTAELVRRQLGGAISALELAHYHRPAVLFLASQGSSQLSRDVAWIADDETLAACIRRFRSTSDGADPHSGSWRLLAACYRELAESYSREALSPELTGVLLRHAGEVGRYPGLLSDVLVESGDEEKLDLRLRAENRVFLEDRDPAARVRAFDWLRARAVELGDYDPFLSRDERRAALAELDAANQGEPR